VIFSNCEYNVSQGINNKHTLDTQSVICDLRAADDFWIKNVLLGFC